MVDRSTYEEFTRSTNLHIMTHLILRAIAKDCVGEDCALAIRPCDGGRTQ
jgi:hypothetical protein